MISREEYAECHESEWELRETNAEITEGNNEINNSQAKQ